MKKLLLASMIFLLLFTIGCSKDNLKENQQNKKEEIVTDFDFRNFNFGMTEKEVRKYEKDVNFINAIDSDDSHYLFGNTKICNLKGTITYEFLNNKLNFVNFISDEEYINCSLYYDDYIKLKNLLIDKHGSPEIENKNKRGDLYNNNIGDALKYEEIDFEDFWNLKNGKIILKCYSKNYKPIISLGYAPKDFNTKNKPNGL